MIDNLLSVMTDEGQGKEEIKNWRKSFLYSFLLLKDFKETEKVGEDKKTFL